jgi:hypothetical protein
VDFTGDLLQNITDPEFAHSCFCINLPLCCLLLAQKKAVKNIPPTRNNSHERLVIISVKNTIRAVNTAPPPFPTS